MSDPLQQPHPSSRISTMAIVSMISGLLGWTLLPFVGSVVAIVTGHLARSEIRRDPRAFEGDGFAVAGLVLGYTMIGVCVLAVIAMLLFFGGLAAFLAIAAHWA